MSLNVLKQIFVIVINDMASGRTFTVFKVLSEDLYLDWIKYQYFLFLLED